LDYTLLIKNPPKKDNWVRLPATEALKNLPLENNAQQTLKDYILQQLVA
jgi:hypothetical protein